MSTTYRALVVYGIKIEYGDLLKTSRVRGCPHPETETETNFCGECGKPMWVETEDDLDIEEHPGKNELGFFYSYGLDKQTEVILGFQIGCVDSYDFGIANVREITPGMTNEIKEFLKENMPHHLGLPIKSYVMLSVS